MGALRMRGLFLALLLAAAPALADVLVDERTPTYEATVATDPALARYPALDAKMRAEAMTALAEFKDWAAHNDTGRPYTFAVADVTLFASDRYVSYVRTLDFYTGGAHGNRGVIAATWDAQRAAPTPLAALVRPEGVAAVAAVLRGEIGRTVHGGPVPEFWAEDVEKALAPAALNRFTLVPGAGGAEALEFHFAPYEVGPYSAGAPSFRVPAAAFAAHLTAEGQALFTP